MGEDPSQGREAVEAEERTPEQIEAEIERTRRDMGDTVAAVAEKADVKAQARQKVDEAKQKVEEAKARLRAKAPASAGDGAGTVGRVASENRRVLAIGGAVLVAFLLGRAAGRE
jgi:chromosome segregation ATPase